MQHICGIYVKPILTKGRGDCSKSMEWYEEVNMSGMHRLTSPHIHLLYRSNKIEKLGRCMDVTLNQHLVKESNIN